jgi:DNA polymerase-4
MTRPSQHHTAIGYGEVPDFHVAIARLERPSLRGRPVLVGGDPAKRGKVVAASHDLREFGIIEGMGLADAIARAPGIEWVPTDIQRAREVSGILRAAVRELVAAIEVEGLAGFYLSAPQDRAVALELAESIEARVLVRTGLPLRIGIAPARFAARLAAEDAGERGSQFVGEQQFEDYLLCQSLERLPGVGPKTAARLEELGAHDVPGLRELGRERLEVLLGNHGRSLWLFACGEDPKPLRVKRHPETLSREETLATATAERAPIQESLARLAESLENALRRDGLSAGRIALRLTVLDERTITRSCTLEESVSSARDLVVAAERLLDRVEPGEGPARRTALVLKGLEARGAEDRQLDLF